MGRSFIDLNTLQSPSKCCEPHGQCKIEIYITQMPWWEHANGLTSWPEARTRWLNPSSTHFRIGKELLCCLYTLAETYTLIYTFIPPTDIYPGLCKCTVSGIQHAGAALSTAHAPDCRRQIHPGPSLLGSGGCHIWGDTVFWKRRESEHHKGEEPPTMIGMYAIIHQLSLPIRVWASTSANREAAGWIWGCGCVLGSPWERVEEADEDVEELWTERLIQ